MKILFFGAGVINTLYAWALDKAGHEVTMYVRPGREKAWADGIRLDLISELHAKTKRIDQQFKPKVVSSFSPADGFDLVIVSVKHYQTREILPLLAKNAGEAMILFFNNQWESLKYIAAQIPQTRYVLGMPRAGGAIDQGVLDGAIKSEVILGDATCGRDAPAEVKTAAKANLEKLVKIFEGAGIKPLMQENMEHWYWAHLASTVPWVIGGAKARGFEPFARDNRAIRGALEAGQECLKILQARGVDVTRVQDLQMFLAPAWLSTLLTRLFISGEVSVKISKGHGSYAPEELQRIYYDVVETGRQLGVSMPKLEAYRPYVDEMSMMIRKEAPHAA